MQRKAYAVLAAILGVAVLVFAIWTVNSNDPSKPTAPVPRGEFATDRATDEPVVPTHPPIDPK